MTTIVDATPTAPSLDGVRPRTKLRSALQWIAWSLPAFPVAVLAHELGHLLWFKVFGFGGVTLHFASVSYAKQDEFWQLARHGRLAEAAAVVPLSEIGLAGAMGIAVTYATLIGAAWLTHKRHAHPFVVAVGLAAALRFIIGIQILPRLLTTSDQMPSGTDEGLVSAVTGIPEALLWGIGFAIVVSSWYFIIRGLPKGSRLAQFGLTVVGGMLGAVAYVGWIGPRLMPE